VATDWRRLTREAGLKVDGEGIAVEFIGERKQFVEVKEPDGAGESIRLWSTVARPSALGETARADMMAWERNRTSDLVGFKIDRRGSLIGEAWVPTAGLTADEWGTYVRHVARTCDRMEYLLTGRDKY
jgi:hypothetical protein